MAFFKFRKGGDEHTTPAPAPESVEAVRKRARHRLIGSVVLVMLGVIGFPLLFDSQPRPIAVDIPIEIPDKNKAKPLGEVVPPALSAPASGAVGAASAPAAAAASAAVAPPVVAPVAPASRAVAGAVSATPARADDGAKAQALLEGKDVKDTKDAGKTPAAAAVRFVVQIGAFADVAKAHEARVKLEKAGLKTYTQVVQAKEGKRIRVRVGPFENKAEADKAAQKIKKLDLPAAVLEL